MNLPIKSNQELTMTSVDFLEQIINPARIEAGEGEVRYNDFITRVKSELDTTHDEIFVMESTGGRTRQAVTLDYDQMMLVGMRESKAVRKSVLSKLHQLESKQNPQLPNFNNPAESARAWADQYEQNQIKQKQLELAAPKVAFVDNLVERDSLMTATQVAQKHHKSAIWLNKILSEIGVYNNAVKRARVFKQDFIDKGYGEMKQTEQGYSQCLFTTAGEAWINEKLISEGVI